MIALNPFELCAWLYISYIHVQSCSYRTHCMCFHILHHYLEFQNISSDCSLNTVAPPGKWRPWCVMLPPTRRRAWSVVYSVLAATAGQWKVHDLEQGFHPAKWEFIWIYSAKKWIETTPSTRRKWKFHQFIRDEDTNQDKGKSHVEICTQKYGDILCDISPGDTTTKTDKWVINSKGIFNQSTCCHEGFGYTDMGVSENRVYSQL